ncbi:MAG: LytTR family transcriptional regulator [Oscillospiraceae bacterium]|nr:LytTR family transcriptional regulator [Oscillospiraceae bacterium]
MKLILTQNHEVTETEVEIRYAEMNAQVRRLAERIGQSENYLTGEEDGRQYRILVDDIFYAESVDRKTFIYTESAVFRSELKLYQLMDKLGHADFVQVGKSCILNINVLDNITTLLNSRMEGTLTNGEKITISRTYIPAIKAAFAGKGGRPV